MKKNLVYIQSGGPTSVINSSLYGAIRQCQKNKDKVEHILGSLHGIEGLIFDDLIYLDKEDDRHFKVEHHRHDKRPGNQERRAEHQADKHGNARLNLIDVVGDAGDECRVGKFVAVRFRKGVYRVQ